MRMRIDFKFTLKELVSVQLKSFGQIMEDRDVILIEIPDRLEKLKRPALQQLCKRFGLKANGKVLYTCQDHE